MKRRFPFLKNSTCFFRMDMENPPVFTPFPAQQLIEIQWRIQGRSTDVAWQGSRCSPCRYPSLKQPKIRYSSAISILGTWIFLVSSAILGTWNFLVNFGYFFSICQWLYTSISIFDSFLKMIGAGHICYGPSLKNRPGIPKKTSHETWEKAPAFALSVVGNDARTEGTLKIGSRMGILGQWLFLVPLKGGRWHIILQLAVCTTYIPLIYCLLGGYILPTTF